MADNLLNVKCAECATSMLVRGSASRFQCNSCGGTNEYLVCPGCKNAVQAMASWPQITHQPCDTTFESPRLGQPTTDPPPPVGQPSDSRTVPPSANGAGQGLSRNAWIGIAVAVLAVLALAGVGQDDGTGGGTTTDDHPLSEDNCRAEARDVMEKYPGVYSSEAEYVAICSGESRDLVDDLVENSPGN